MIFFIIQLIVNVLKCLQQQEMSQSSQGFINKGHFLLHK